jgi:hypothetical protein
MRRGCLLPAQKHGGGGRKGFSIKGKPGRDRKSEQQGVFRKRDQHDIQKDSLGRD